MKIIDRETVEDAIEIFFSLNDEELKEDVNNLKESQKLIYDLIKTTEKTPFRVPVQMNIVWRLTLVIDHCFNTFYDEMRTIPNSVLLKKMTFMEKEERTQRRDNGGFRAEKIIDESGQKDLIADVMIKAYYCGEEGKVLNESEAYHLNLLIISLVLIYQEQAKKMNFHLN
jgi:hypothetical protein